MTASAFGAPCSRGISAAASLFLSLLISATSHARVAAQQPDLPYGFHVGEAFPTLAFPALEDGAPTSVTDFRGQRLILHVFASW